LIYAEIYENLEYTNNTEYTAIELYEDYKKTGKFRSDCDITTNFYIAALRSIGIEAYAVNVLVDNKGRRVSERLYKRKKGWNHICAVVRAKDGNVIQVDLGIDKKNVSKGISSLITYFSHFAIEHKEIRILSDIEHLHAYFNENSNLRIAPF